MEGLIIAAVLGAVVLAGGLVSTRTRIPAPWAWVVLGAGLSFVPGLTDVSLPPDVVLFLFLPALLYWESINTSLQQLRYDMRVILLLSIGLVVATAAVVTGLGVLLGVALPVAVVLGAIVSPTDATAVAALSDGLPRRVRTILRGESLINDGSALALYSVAVAAVVAGVGLNPGMISLRFVYAVVLGVAIGLAVGFVLYLLRRFAHQPDLNGAISFLSPFALFLPAQAIGASGVVAVVAGGLMLGRLMPRVVSARARNEGFSFWRVTTYVINGTLFVLVGLQARPVAATFVGDGWAATLALALLVAFGVFVIRIAWISAIAPIIRLLDRRATQRARRSPYRERLVIGWGGFRGAVSLAAALALPLETDDGHPFPGRQTIIAVTLVVILLTLFLQGATMPVIVRRARFSRDDGERRERALALHDPIDHALEHLDEDAVAEGATDDARAWVRSSLEHEARTAPTGPRDADAHPDAPKHRLILRTIERRREAIIRLRNEGRIDDEIMLEAQNHLDFEELRLRER